MILLALLLADGAAAQETSLDVAILDTAVGCFSRVAIFSVPDPGDTNVPLDVVPAFVYDTGTCAVDPTSLRLEADGQAVAEEDVEIVRGLAELAPGSALAVDTEHVFTDESTSSGSVSVAFTTGSDVHTPLTYTPSVTALTADWDESAASLVLEATAALDGAGGGDLVVQLADGAPDDLQSGITRTLAPGAERSVRWSTQTRLSAAPDRWCVLPKLREVDGTWIEGEAQCVDVESGCGCSQGGPGAAAAPLLIAGWLLSRRRTT